MTKTICLSLPDFVVDNLEKLRQEKERKTKKKFTKSEFFLEIILFGMKKIS